MTSDRQLIVRRRLVERLDERFNVSLVTMTANAGFGKTTLVHQTTQAALDSQRSREILVRCRSGAHADEPFDRIADILGAPAFIGAIADAILSESPVDVVLWIDDVHHLASDPSFADQVSELLDRLPGNGHLVLVGRALPVLRTARLRANGDLLELVERDLRFDTDETAEFAEVRGLERTEAAGGWPALMELELSSGSAGAIDYLTEEVLGALRDGHRSALERLAVVDSFDEPLVRAVTRFDGTMDDLLEPLPLVQVDGASIVLHDLLKDALLVNQTVEQRSESLTEVAGALLGRDRVIESARCFAEAADRSGLRAVAERMVLDESFSGSATERADAVRIVSEGLGDDAIAGCLDALTATIADPADAAARLRRASEVAAAAGRTDLHARVLRSLCELAYTNARLEELQHHAAEFTSLAATGEPFAQRWSFVPELYLLRSTGRTAEIPEFVDRLLASDELDVPMRAIALFYRTVSLAYSGRVVEALTQANVHSADFPAGLFSDRIAGVVLTQRWMLGDVDPAELPSAVDLINRIELRGQRQLFVEGAASVAMFHASFGMFDTMRELIARAESGLAQLRDQTWSFHTVAQARAVAAVIDGDEPRAAAELDRAIPDNGPIYGLPSHVYFPTAALSYLLVPRTRTHWESSPTAPDLDLRTRVGQALVAVRERGEVGPAAALPWATPERLRAWAPGPLFVELATAAASAGVDDATAVVTSAVAHAHDELQRLCAASLPKVASTARKLLRTTPRRPDEVLEIGVLGELRVERGQRDETSTSGWRRTKVRELLLLLVHQRSLSRDRAAAVLWPDKPKEAAFNNLRVTLSQLLAGLEPDREGGAPSWFVRTEGADLTLERSDWLTIDADRFRRLLRQARIDDVGAPRRALDTYVSACELYRGDYLGGVYLDGVSFDDSAYYEGLRLRGDFVSAAVRAADLALASGSPELAETLALRASETEPLNEAAVRTLTAALMARRRFGAAAEVLKALLGHLGEIQIPPEPETRRVAARLGIAV